MARKVRLNQSHRTMLERKAREVVTLLLRPLARKRDKALDALRAAAMTAFRKDYPEADMAILQKYEAGDYDCELRVATAGNSAEYVQIGFDEPFTKPRYNTTVLVRAGLISQWLSLSNEYKKQHADRLRPYTNLIRSATYFEEVVDGWEGAKALEITPATCTALLCVTKSDLDAIKADEEQLRRTTAKVEDMAEAVGA
jgi:hypothetical protein